ncbi:MAG TPA: dCTP deaminase [Polyangiaceae bacterium]|jgi:dCTP deaminase|nr:dCTP deaminase [Polyangiaceae bacterium]
MILSDRDIRARLRDGSLKITGIVDEAQQLQPASVDLRLSAEFLTYKPAQVTCLDPRQPETLTAGTERVTVPEGSAFILHPGEFVLGSTMERVTIPPDLVARVDGRSSVGRLAIVVHATAGFIDPGFEGEITLELSNIGRIPVRLYPGMRIAQVVFQLMTSPAERPYGRARGSHYHEQEGPQASRISLDG